MRRHLQPVAEINYDLLDRVEEKALAYQQKFPELSEVYVPGEGEGYPPTAFVLGEAPGAQEVMARRPFVGPAGRVLRQLMATAGLYPTGKHLEDKGKEWQEANCWLTNSVHFRPPKNRTPTDREIEYARAIVRDEWMAVGMPRVVVAVGGVAHQALTGKKVSILSVSGKPRRVQSRQSNVEITLWPMVHPSFAIRNPAMRDILEKDWIKLGDWLSERGNA